MFILTVLFLIAPKINGDKVPPQIERSSLDLSTAKSYELQVPGSNTIHIIDAEPPWYRQNLIFPERHPKYLERTSAEHRSIKKQLEKSNLPSTQETKTSLVEPFTNKCYGVSCGNELDYNRETTSELSKLFNSMETFKNQRDQLFLNSEHFENQIDRKDSNKRLLEIERFPDLRLVDQDGNNLKKVYMDPETQLSLDKMLIKKSDNFRNEDKQNEEENQVSKISTVWNDVEIQNQKNPQEDREGWVKLDVIPWSTTKISKWENNKQTEFPSESNRPLGPPGSVYSWNTSPLNYAKKKVTNNENLFYSQNYQQDWASESPQKLSWKQPYGSWDRNQAPRPAPYQATRPSYNHEDCKDDYKHHSHHSSYPDLIIDQSPSSFPSDDPYKKPPHRDSLYAGSSSGYNVHPSSHPVNGNGQWVLLSTTKGYQYPATNKHRQRSLELRPEIMTSRRSIKLTVLPAANGSEINMTTSHGGILQVESTFESVDDARKNYIRKMKHQQNYESHEDNLSNFVELPGDEIKISASTNHQASISTGSIKNQKAPQFQTTGPGGNSVKQRPHKGMKYPVNHKKHTPDSNAILAAVGAGMVPATMAMVMPFVLGRKRRDLNNNYLGAIKVNVTHTPAYEIESTLKRSL